MDYEGVAPDQLILRDYLALDRTILANERTLLAYIRTGIAFAAGGATLLKVFAPSWPMIASGAALVAAGIFAAIKGTRRYRTTSLRLRRIVRSDVGGDARS